MVTPGYLWATRRQEIIVVNIPANILYSSLIGDWSMIFEGRHFDDLLRCCVVARRRKLALYLRSETETRLESMPLMCLVGHRLRGGTIVVCKSPSETT